MADYVLALVKSEDEDEVVMSSASQNLEDFLKERKSVPPTPILSSPHAIRNLNANGAKTRRPLSKILCPLSVADPMILIK